MKQAWNRLGSPDAISWVLVVLLLIQQVSGSLTAPFADIHGRIPEFLAVRICSLMVTVAVLGLGKVLLRTFARERPLPWLTLTAFAIATLAGTTAQNALLIFTGFTTEWTLGRRFLLAIPGSFAILVISGLLISMARELARRNQELAETARELLVTRSEATKRIEQRKADLVTTVETQLEQSLATTQSDNSSDIAERLKNLVDDVIRPLSFQISNEVASFEPPAIEVANPKISWRALLTNAMTTNPGHPATTMTWLGILVAIFLIPTLGLRGLLAAIAVSAITFLGLTAVRLLWRFLPEGLQVFARASIFGVVVAGLMALCTPAMDALSGYGFTTLNAFIGWLILACFMTWTVTLFFAVRDTLRETRASLLTTVDELKREVIQLNSEMRRLQKGISRVLHGPVQEIVSASIYRLQAQGTASGHARVADVNERISAAIQLLNNPLESTIDLESASRDLVELWDDVAAISIDIPLETRQRLAQDANATNVLMELIREACGNAIRHGEAKHIRVSAYIEPADDTVELIVENDGRPLPNAARPGLGSQIFDDLCLSWSREQVGRLVQLEARIPLAR